MLTPPAVKILVAVKRVPDPEQKLKFKGDSLDSSAVNWVLNPFDEYAIETALRLAEKADTQERLAEVIVVSIGPPQASQQIRSCLAMGADRAILVSGDDEALDSEVVARALIKIYQEEKPDLFLFGKQAVDGDSNQVPQLIAGYLNLPQACFASSIEMTADQKTLTVEREADGGVETKRIPLPAVVSVDLRIVLPKAVRNNATPAEHAYQEGPRYASLKGIMAAKKKELREVSLADLGVPTELRVKVLKMVAPPARKAGVKVGSVPELVKKLHEEAKVI